MSKLLSIAAIAVAAFLLFRAATQTTEGARGLASIAEASLSPGLPQVRPVTTRVEAESVSGTSSVERAEDFLNRHREEWRVQPYHELRAQAFDSIVGSRVVYHAYQDGLPILGMEIEIDISQDSRAKLVRNDYRPLKQIDLASVKALPPEQLLDQNTDRLGAATTTSAPASVLYVSPGSDEPELAYALSFAGAGPRQRSVQALVRATDGQLLARTASRIEFGR